MKYIDIENNIKLDFKINDRPYVIKQYAKDWYAYNNWSFEFIKNLDPNLMLNHKHNKFFRFYC